MAEGAGLLNRFTVKSRNGGSNPPLSASFFIPDTLIPDTLIPDTCNQVLRDFLFPADDTSRSAPKPMHFGPKPSKLRTLAVIEMVRCLG